MGTAKRSPSRIKPRFRQTLEVDTLHLHQVLQTDNYLQTVRVVVNIHVVKGRSMETD